MGAMDIILPGSTRPRKPIPHGGKAAHGVKKADLAMLFPYEVRRLLKSYDVASLSWNNPDDRYAIVREVLTRGDDVAHEWLFETMTIGDVRALVLQYGAAGVAEPGRVTMRQRLGLSVEKLPTRPYLGSG